MNKFIEYFIKNSHLNHILLLFVIYIGSLSYMNLPKEFFPTIELEKIKVQGSYSGTSSINLDKMAVRDIEDSLSNVNGVNKIETTIIPGSFNIVLTISEDYDKEQVLNKVKDAIAENRQYFPEDMNEPIATIVDKQKSLLRVAIGSNTLPKGELIEIAKKYKTIVSKFDYISEVEIRGDSDKEINIKLNVDAINAFQLNSSEVINAIRNISHIYPIGEIEEKGNYIYVSTANGKIDINEWKNTLLKINDKFILLSDIAFIKEYYPETQTISSFNGNSNISLVISKGEDGDSIKIAKEIREFFKNEKIENCVFTIYSDTSKPIEDRLNIVISNIVFGFLLIFFSMWILINIRIAVIVSIGIPFSFLIGLTFLYYLGYSINIISLLGALIVVGIVVDDAVVISENIQRYIEEGMDKFEAAVKGTKEMIFPVTLAAVTTFASFIPMFMLQGEMGLFIVLIPIVAIMVLLGSLIDSILFLPLHAYEFMNKSHELINWNPLQDKYENILKKFIEYKKTFLTLFILITISSTFILLKTTKFQFFPKFDGNYLYVTAKVDTNIPIEHTHKISKEIEDELLKYKEKLSIKSISATTGYRQAISNDIENGNNMIFLTLELFEKTPENILDKYINPTLDLTFKYSDPEKIRIDTTYELVPKINSILENVKNKYEFIEFGVIEETTGLIKNDIRIDFIGGKDELISNVIKEINLVLANTKGIKNYSDNVKYGKFEYKLKVNNYGETLGLNETTLAKLLSSYFSDKKQATTFGNTGVMEIKTEDNKKDNISSLLNFNIPIGEKYVLLKDVVDIIIIQDYEKLEKLNGNIIKSIFANVDPKIITANEVLEKLEPILNKAKEQGINFSFQGEKEKNKQLQSDMKKAVVAALFLIIVSLLLIFPNIKVVLMVMSVIPFSIIGALIGHKLLGLNLTMPSIIGILGLAGVVINDGIVMVDFIQKVKTIEEVLNRTKQRIRPILITSITTFLGMSSLIFYASNQAVILQPIAVSIGFGLIWGTILNLFYLPTLFVFINKIKNNKEENLYLPKDY